MSSGRDETMRYRAHFAVWNEIVRAREPAWMQAQREAAFARFEALGFPTTRQEEWRFTNIAPLLRASFHLATTPAPLPEDDWLTPYRAWGAHHLVFANGHFVGEVPANGHPPRFFARGIRALLQEAPHLVEPYLRRPVEELPHAFIALNAAFLTDGAFVRIPRGAVVREPIHVLFLALGQQEPLIVHPRNVIVAEENSQATIIESYVSLDDSHHFTNAVTELIVEENAVVQHYKVQREGRAAFHMAAVRIAQARMANVFDFSLALGAALARTEITAILEGEGADCTLNGFYWARDQQLVDHHTVIEHVAPHGTSREFYKGILDDAARGVFDGTIIVRPGAQKTDARQVNKNLLLSTEALVNTNPRLQILADDVKCSHGATIGHLDEEALFYCRSRGLDAEMARELLTYAFASDILQEIAFEPLRRRVREWVLMEWPDGERLTEML
ncbi:FeS cluster assembly protein SufD [bacterium HR08]|nr:FeS cluster assembly protein SufD [bacterium HR08]